MTMATEPKLDIEKYALLPHPIHLEYISGFYDLYRYLKIAILI